MVTSFGTLESMEWSSYSVTSDERAFEIVQHETNFICNHAIFPERDISKSPIVCCKLRIIVPELIVNGVDAFKDVRQSLR